VTIVGLLATAGYATRFSGGRPPRDALYRWDSVANGLIQYGVMLGLMLLVLIGAPKREPFALRRPRSWGAAIGLSIAIFVGIFVLSYVVGLFVDPGREQGLVPDRWEPQHAAAFAANFGVVAVVAPIVEELTFRGLGFTLLERFGTAAAIVLVGLAFGLAHGLVEALPILAAFGAALAYLRSRTDSVLPGMLLHATFNAFVLVTSVHFFREGALGSVL
jgi:uncharacterized protein